jgi:flavin reductase (DIM6/NTAB) family NADH-FMN oxidoreductase RutF
MKASALQAPLQEEFPLERAFTFVESGPVLLLSTYHKQKHNLMTISCHASIGFEPLIAVAAGPWNYSFEALKASGECVIAIPPSDIMEKVVDIGNCSGSEIDKFAQYGLTPLAAAKVKAPLVGECMRNLECRVIDSFNAYNLFILKGIKAWQNPLLTNCRPFHANGDGTFTIDSETVNLRHRMTKWQHCI